MKTRRNVQNIRFCKERTNFKMKKLFYFVFFAWASSTRSSSSQSWRQAKRCGSPFFCFFPSGSGERDRQTPIKSWELFLHFLNSCTWNYFASLAKALKCFQIVLRRETQKVWRHNRVSILSSKHTYRVMKARALSEIFIIVNNYSLKWRWIVMDINRAAKREGKYPSLRHRHWGE